MNIIIPLDAMWRFEERTPAVVAEVRNLLKHSEISVELWHEFLVNEFDRLYALDTEEWPYQMALLADRAGLLMLQAQPTEEEMEAHVHLLEAYTCAFYGALWPFLQTLGYDDGHVPQLRFLRQIGEQAVLVSDQRDRPSDPRPRTLPRSFARSRL